MICVKTILAGLIAVAFGAAAMAADDSPTPTTTTSPGKSSTLIQTDTFPDGDAKLVVRKSDAVKYANSRKALKSAAIRFQRLARQAEKGMSPALRTELTAALRSVGDNAKTLSKLIGRSKTRNGKSIGSKLDTASYIKMPEIEGKSGLTNIRAVSRRLSDLDRQLALLEPVVHR